MAIARPALRRLRGRIVDFLVLALAVWAVAEAVWEPLPPVGAMVVLCPSVSLPLLVRHRFPLVAPLVGVAALLAVSLTAPGTVSAEMQVFLAAMLVFWSMGSDNPIRNAILGLVAGEIIVTVGTVLDPVEHLDDLIFAVLTFGGCWAAGLAFGRRAQDARRFRAEAHERELVAAEALARERARISRDVHDVVAHSVGLIVVQLGAADRVLDDDPAAAREAIRASREIGKSALVELRGVLALLGDGRPAKDLPVGLSELDRLIDTVTGAGLSVQLQVDGQPRKLPQGLDATAYRVVQEALTNALKHAGSRLAKVELRWNPADLTICVGSAGGTENNELPGSGRGLLSMRERVQLYGGCVTAARTQDGFEVRAVLPLPGPSS